MDAKQIKAAREALDNLDDCARIDTGVNAIGPRSVLESFINLVEGSAQPTPTSAAEGVPFDTSLLTNNPDIQQVRAAYVEAIARAEAAEARVRELEAAAKGLPIKTWQQRAEDLGFSGRPQGYPDTEEMEQIKAAEIAELRAALASPSLPNQAVVYPPDGTVSPFTVINLGSGKVRVGDSFHDGRLHALWFGKDGTGIGDEQVLNRAAYEGETISVVTFANVEGLDVLLGVVERIRRKAFPGALPRSLPTEVADNCARPDLLEKLTYHAYERDDMTIEDLLQTLSKDGYKNVRQRTHRQIELQLLALLAGQPAPTEAAGSLTDERAKFQAHFITEGWSELSFERYNIHDPADERGYKCRHVSDMWDGWIARAAQPVPSKEAVSAAMLPNGAAVTNVYDAYEEGRKSMLPPAGGGLPTLPKCKMLQGKDLESLRALYTADQMREYGLACIRANSAALPTEDTARLDWLIAESAVVEEIGGRLYRVYWLEADEWQQEMHPDPRAAIDAARAAAGKEGQL